MRALISTAQGLIETDGTSAGSTLLVSASSSACGAAGDIVRYGNGAIYTQSISGSFQLWLTDGTVAGTQLITSLPATDYGGLITLTAVGDRVLFAYTDGTSPGYGYNIWTTDCTAAGTLMFPNTGASLLGATSGLLPGGKLVFVGPSFQVQVTDGTAAGTLVLLPSSPATTYADGPFRIAVVGADALIPIVVGPDHFSAVSQIWASDGTFAGTHPAGCNNPGWR